MASFILSSVAFLIAGYFLRRYLDDIGIPRGMTRNTIVFLGALLISYVVAYVIDLIVG